MASSLEASKRVLRNQVDKIKQKFETAMDRNNKAGDLDRLQRRDFIVEYELRDELVADGDG